MSPLPADPWPEAHLDAVLYVARGLLERPGLRVDSPAAAKLLLAAGCGDAGNGRYSIPWEAVEDALASATTSFTLAARDPARGVAVSPAAATTWVHNFAETPFLTDPRTGATRQASVVDQLRAARVMHQLRYPDFLHAVFTVTELPGTLQPLVSYCLLATESDKYLAGPGMWHPVQVWGLSELAALVTGADGDRGHAEAPRTIDVSVSPVSPLSLGAEVAETLIEAARLGVACRFLPCPVAGTTAPASLVTAVGQQTAEALAMLVLAQAAAPGAACFYGARLIACDPRTGGFAAGGPEMGFCAVGATLAARRLGLACDVYGLSTDSKVIDAQFALERSLGALTAALAHPAFISGVGLTQSGIGGCLEAMPIDDEILRRIAWTLTPADAGPQAVDLEALREGALAATGYLGTRHTRSLMRRDLYLPALANRGGLEEWLASGDASLVDAAERRVTELLRTEPPAPPDDLLGEMDRVLRDCAERLERAGVPDGGRPPSLRALLDDALPEVPRG